MALSTSGRYLDPSPTPCTEISSLWITNANGHTASYGVAGRRMSKLGWGGCWQEGYKQECKIIFLSRTSVISKKQLDVRGKQNSENMVRSPGTRRKHPSSTVWTPLVTCNLRNLGLIRDLTMLQGSLLCSIKKLLLTSNSFHFLFPMCSSFFSFFFSFSPTHNFLGS